MMVNFTSQVLDSRYDGDNCLEIELGNDLRWMKQVNADGQVEENLLLQDVDGGQKAVDVLGDEHFDKVRSQENMVELYFQDKLVCSYQRNGKNQLFRRREPHETTPQNGNGGLVRWQKVAAENQGEKTPKQRSGAQSLNRAFRDGAYYR